MTGSRKAALQWPWKELNNRLMANTPPGSLATLRGAVLIVFFLLFLSGCGGLAPVKPVSQTDKADIARRCRAHFPDRPWQLVQSLTAYLPNGEIRNAVSVTRIYPEDLRIRCVIMSLEGIVLFNGQQYDNRLEVKRAVPPFDSNEFAEALFDDIRLVFFRPSGSIIETGTDPAGTPVCRYELDGSQGFADMLFAGKQRIRIRRYGPGKKLLKTVKACYAPDCMPSDLEPDTDLPGKIEITHHGFLGYRLVMDLIRAENQAPK